MCSRDEVLRQLRPCELVVVLSLSHLETRFSMHCLRSFLLDRTFSIGQKAGFFTGD